MIIIFAKRTFLFSIGSFIFSATLLWELCLLLTGLFYYHTGFCLSYRWSLFLSSGLFYFLSDLSLFLAVLQMKYSLREQKRPLKNKIKVLYSNIYNWLCQLIYLYSHYSFIHIIAIQTKGKILHRTENSAEKEKKSPLLENIQLTLPVDTFIFSLFFHTYYIQAKGKILHRTEKSA